MVLPLYKYENFNEHAISNLRDNAIYGSDPNNFNDPLDAKSKLINIEIKDENLENTIERLFKGENRLKKELENYANDEKKSMIISSYKATIDKEFGKLEFHVFQKMETIM